MTNIIIYRIFDRINRNCFDFKNFEALYTYLQSFDVPESDWEIILGNSKTNQRDIIKKLDILELEKEGNFYFIKIPLKDGSIFDAGAFTMKVTIVDADKIDLSNMKEFCYYTTRYNDTLLKTFSNFDRAYDYLTDYIYAYGIPKKATSYFLGDFQAPYLYNEEYLPPIPETIPSDIRKGGNLHITVNYENENEDYFCILKEEIFFI